MTPRPVRVVLASSSPGRRRILLGAGIEPELLVPDVDEEAIRARLTDADPEGLVQALAVAKVEAVEAAALADAEHDQTVVVIGCDSLLHLDGALMGKPATPEMAIADFERMSGRTARVLTGHHVVLLHPVDGRTERRAASAVSATGVEFADLHRGEIEAYVATGEPLRIAGCTVEGVGGAFIRAVHGDPHGIGGLSLPLFRELVVSLGCEWQRLWNRGSWIADSD